MAAASEVFWSNPARKGYDDFLSRLPHMLNLYTDKGFEFRQDVFNPDLQIRRCINPDSVEINCEVMAMRLSFTRRTEVSPENNPSVMFFLLKLVKTRW